MSVIFKPVRSCEELLTVLKFNSPYVFPIQKPSISANFPVPFANSIVGVAPGTGNVFSKTKVGNALSKRKIPVEGSILISLLFSLINLTSFSEEVPIVSAFNDDL